MAARSSRLHAAAAYGRYVVLRGLRAWVGGWLGHNPFRISRLELIKLQMAPRFRTMHVNLLGRRLEVTDSSGTWQCYHELLLEEIYRFRASRPNPRIIDCGANIGLSIIYFKQLYPAADIVAFEPDAAIFGALQRNVRSFGFENVSLRQEAVWTGQGEVSFQPDGGFGGRLDQPAASGPKVRTVRLYDWLEAPLDLLKLDIEGAESAVIADCQDRLINVERLFVEFHGKRQEPQRLGEMLEILRRAGFRYHLKEASPVRHPFLAEERQGEFDLQLNIFAYRD